MRFYKREGKKDIRTMWVSECDDTLISHLESRGFFCDDNYMDYRQQTLEVPSENPDLPPGYSIATVNKHEAGKRAAVSHAAFESGKGIEEYTENYRRFMDSPVYDPEMDLVVVAPEGRFAAFCLCWADKETKSGYIEPFGTHPEYRRRGLGKALLRTALIKLKTLGMETASICVEADNEAAENLYEATGFHRVIKNRTYVKNVL